MTEIDLKDEIRALAMRWRESTAELEPWLRSRGYGDEGERCAAELESVISALDRSPEPRQGDAAMRREDLTAELHDLINTLTKTIMARLDRPAFRMSMMREAFVLALIESIEAAVESTGAFR